MVKVAIPVADDDSIFGHFGLSTRFKMYNLSEQVVMTTAYLSVPEEHGSQKFKALLDEQVDVVIVNSIGPGVMRMFDMTDIAVYAGVSGNADDAVQIYLSGGLIHDTSAVKCCGRH